MRLEATPDDLALILRELQRLDAWSFWAVPLGPEGGLDVAVVGTTGAYLVRPCGLEGRLAYERGGVTIDGRRVRGLRALRGSARKLKDRLDAASVFTGVEPVLCLTRAIAGAAHTVGGVHVVHVADLPADIGERAKVLEPNRAQRGAASLGSILPSARIGRPEPSGSDETEADTD